MDWDLNDLIEICYQSARDLLIGRAADDDAPPVMTGFSRTIPVFSILSPFAEPFRSVFGDDVMGRIATRALQEHDCDAYTIAAEMWFAKKIIPRGSPLPNLDSLPLPSTLADRHEGYVIYAENDVGQTAGKCWELQRDAQGCISGLVADPDLGGAGSIFQSLRFGGLLARPRMN